MVWVSLLLFSFLAQGGPIGASGVSPFGDLVQTGVNHDIGGRFEIRRSTHMQGWSLRYMRTAAGMPPRELASFHFGIKDGMLQWRAFTAPAARGMGLYADLCSVAVEQCLRGPGFAGVSGSWVDTNAAVYSAARAAGACETQAAAATPSIRMVEPILNRQGLGIDWSTFSAQTVHDGHHRFSYLTRPQAPQRLSLFVLSNFSGSILASNEAGFAAGSVAYALPPAYGHSITTAEATAFSQCPKPGVLSQAPTTVEIAALSQCSKPSLLSRVFPLIARIGKAGMGAAAIGGVPLQMAYNAYSAPDKANHNPLISREALEFFVELPGPHKGRLLTLGKLNQAEKQLENFITDEFGKYSRPSLSRVMKRLHEKQSIYSKCYPRLYQGMGFR